MLNYFLDKFHYFKFPYFWPFFMHNYLFGLWVLLLSWETRISSESLSMDFKDAKILFYRPSKLATNFILRRISVCVRVFWYNQDLFNFDESVQYVSYLIEINYSNLYIEHTMEEPIANILNRNKWNSDRRLQLIRAAFLAIMKPIQAT